MIQELQPRRIELRISGDVASLTIERHETIDYSTYRHVETVPLEPATAEAFKRAFALLGKP